MLADTPLPRGFGAALASVDTFFPRAPEQFVTSPLCLVGYVRWDARSDRVPPLQTIIFSSFPGRTPVTRQIRSWASRRQFMRLWLRDRFLRFGELVRDVLPRLCNPSSELRIVGG